MQPNTERYEQIEKRSAHACTILATMALASATICFFGQPITGTLLNATVGTFIGSAIGLIMFAVIQLNSNTRR